MRIVSLVPSITEALCMLGLEDSSWESRITAQLAHDYSPSRPLLKFACNRLGATVSDEERLAGGNSMQLRLRFTLSFVLLDITTAACFAAPGGAGPEKPVSVAVVELFTSEGCSSCPPADTLLREINLKQINTGQLIVGISEHVTYWNDLGWKDPFSSPVFTERQSNYASRLSLEGSYTPQMVLNGREQFVGSNVGALKLALRDDAQRDHLGMSILSSAPSSAGLDVKFSLTGNVRRPLDIVAVLTDDADRSSVQRGENSGRVLQHVSVARLLTRVAIVKGDEEESAHIPLPDGFQLGGSGHHLILFAQEQHQGAIVGAATVPL